MTKRAKQVAGFATLFSWLVLAGCGHSNSGSIVPVPTPVPATTLAGTIYGPNPITGVGIISVLTTGAIASSSTITVPGLSYSAPILQGIAVDALGEIYVGEQLTSGTAPTGSVLVFAAGAGATAAPIRTIVGANTKLSTPSRLAVDAAGDVYVAQTIGDVVEFAAGANGNAAPIRTLKGFGGSNTGIVAVLGMGVDAGGNLYLANYVGKSLTTTLTGVSVNNVANNVNDILVFSPTQSGDVTPSRIIGGDNTRMAGDISGISFDSSGNLYTVTESLSPLFQAILEFSAGANGNVAPIREITGSSTTLTGASLTNPVLDSSGNLYVFANAGGVVSLVKFAPDANGNASPSAVSPTGTTINSFQIALH